MCVARIQYVHLDASGYAAILHQFNILESVSHMCANLFRENSTFSNLLTGYAVQFLVN